MQPPLAVVTDPTRMAEMWITNNNGVSLHPVVPRGRLDRGSTPRYRKAQRISGTEAEWPSTGSVGFRSLLASYYKHLVVEDEYQCRLFTGFIFSRITPYLLCGFRSKINGFGRSLIRNPAGTSCPHILNTGNINAFDKLIKV